jgi:alpha-D-xyloside xylohydrolase
VWKEDYTMLRMLAFDFAEDAIARVVDDQFLFGSSLMVCPVTEPMYYEKNSRPIEGAAKTREVYLPGGTGWYDFWTNRYYEGGQTITAAAPIDIIPLYVKAGSILPMTQFMQYVDELPDAPVEVRIYSGKDTEFELFEDEGDSYRYEEGEYAITKLAWSERNQKLEVNKPIGTYRGMVKDREYQVVIIKS